jgi:hypothetical protein
MWEILETVAIVLNSVLFILEIITLHFIQKTLDIQDKRISAIAHACHLKEHYNNDEEAE